MPADVTPACAGDAAPGLPWQAGMVAVRVADVAWPAGRGLRKSGRSALVMAGGGEDPHRGCGGVLQAGGGRVGDSALRRAGAGSRASGGSRPSRRGRGETGRPDRQAHYGDNDCGGQRAKVPPLDDSTIILRLELNAPASMPDPGTDIVLTTLNPGIASSKALSLPSAASRDFPSVSNPTVTTSPPEGRGG